MSPPSRGLGVIGLDALGADTSLFPRPLHGGPVLRLYLVGEGGPALVIPRCLDVRLDDFVVVA